MAMLPEIESPMGRVRKNFIDDDDDMMSDDDEPIGY
jgi:hypothetical protein